MHSDKILQIGQFHLPDAGDNWTTWDHMRDAVIDEITVKGRAQPPAVVANLIRGFLQRLFFSSQAAADLSDTGSP